MTFNKKIENLVEELISIIHFSSIDTKENVRKFKNIVGETLFNKVLEKEKEICSGKLNACITKGISELIHNKVSLNYETPSGPCSIMENYGMWVSENLRCYSYDHKLRWGDFEDEAFFVGKFPTMEFIMHDFRIKQEIDLDLLENFEYVLIHYYKTRVNGSRKIYEDDLQTDWDSYILQIELNMKQMVINTVLEPEIKSVYNTSESYTLQDMLEDLETAPWHSVEEASESLDQNVSNFKEKKQKNYEDKWTYTLDGAIQFLLLNKSMKQREIKYFVMRRKKVFALDNNTLYYVSTGYSLEKLAVLCDCIYLLSKFLGADESRKYTNLEVFLTSTYKAKKMQKTTNKNFAIKRSQDRKEKFMNREEGETSEEGTTFSSIKKTISLPLEASQTMDDIRSSLSKFTTNIDDFKNTIPTTLTYYLVDLFAKLTTFVVTISTSTNLVNAIAAFGLFLLSIGLSQAIITTFTSLLMKPKKVEEASVGNNYSLLSIMEGIASGFDTIINKVNMFIPKKLGEFVRNIKSVGDLVVFVKKIFEWTFYNIISSVTGLPIEYLKMSKLERAILDWLTAVEELILSDTWKLIDRSHDEALKLDNLLNSTKEIEAQFALGKEVRPHMRTSYSRAKSLLVTMRTKAPVSEINTMYRIKPIDIHLIGTGGCGKTHQIGHHMEDVMQFIDPDRHFKDFARTLNYQPWVDFYDGYPTTLRGIVFDDWMQYKEEARRTVEMMYHMFISSNLPFKVNVDDLKEKSNPYKHILFSYKTSNHDIGADMTSIVSELTAVKRRRDIVALAIPRPKTCSIPLVKSNSVIFDRNRTLYAFLDALTGEFLDPSKNFGKSGIYPNKKTMNIKFFLNYDSWIDVTSSISRHLLFKQASILLDLCNADSNFKLADCYKGLLAWAAEQEDNMVFKHQILVSRDEQLRSQHSITDIVELSTSRSSIAKGKAPNVEEGFWSDTISLVTKLEALNAYFLSEQNDEDMDKRCTKIDELFDETFALSIPDRDYSLIEEPEIRFDTFMGEIGKLNSDVDVLPFLTPELFALVNVEDLRLTKKKHNFLVSTLKRTLKQFKSVMSRVTDKIKAHPYASLLMMGIPVIGALFAVYLYKTTNLLEEGVSGPGDNHNKRNFNRIRTLGHRVVRGIGYNVEESASSIDDQLTNLYTNSLVKVRYVSMSKLLRNTHGILMGGYVLMTPMHLLSTRIDENDGYITLGTVSGIYNHMDFQLKDLEFYHLKSKDVLFILLPVPKKGRKNACGYINPARALWKHVISDEQISRANLENLLFLRLVGCDEWLTNSALRPKTYALQCETVTVVSREETDRYKTAQGGFAKIMNVIRYLISSKGGYCGCPLLVLDASINSRLIAIHVASDSTVATGTMLEAGMYEGLPDYYFAGSHLPPIHSSELPEFLESEEIEGIEQFGMVSKEEGARVYCKNDIHKSPIYETLEIAKLAPSLTTKKHNYDPMKIGILRLSHGKRNINQEELYTCYASMSSQLQINHTQIPKRLLTIREAINGNSSIQFLRSLKHNASPGWRYLKLTNSGGKKPFYITIHNNRSKETYYMPDDFLTDNITQSLYNLETYGYDPFIAVFCIKVEKLKLAKVAIGESRLFTTFELHAVILIRIYFGMFVAHLQTLHGNMECQVGMNPHGKDWDFLYRKLKSGEANYFTADYTRFDQRMLYSILSLFGEFANKYYNDGFSNIRIAIITSILGSYLLCGRELYRVHGPNHSGNPLTVIINSFANSMLIRWSYLKYCANVGTPFSEYDDNIVAIVYGDDCIVKVKLGCSFNLCNMAGNLLQLNVIITPGNKEDEMTPYILFKDIDFLKRKFVINDKILCAPLNWRSMCGMLDWIEKSPSDIASVAANITSFKQELVHFGNESFNLYSDIVDQACIEADVQVYPISFLEASRMRSEMVGYYAKYT